MNFLRDPFSHVEYQSTCSMVSLEIEREGCLNTLKGSILLHKGFVTAHRTRCLRYTETEIGAQSSVCKVTFSVDVQLQPRMTVASEQVCVKYAASLLSKNRPSLEVTQWHLKNLCLLRIYECIDNVMWNLSL